MKRKANTEVYRKMERPQLIKEITNMKEELMKVRFQAASGQLQNAAQLKTVRRRIAQAMTVLSASANS